ncbi:hypothetical protein Pint_00862 [Pistacia integerrima]|uniref:Uncharacterized protein n=1 Tax=Pistacia integerrima TaxID=434235 RepID=A0ACC0ZJM6_9ROSI|nr:hypothetical protein Pint_00862 [Pistacia integerrima]
MLLLLISAIPFAYIISLERTKFATHVYQYHSSGFMRECAKWDQSHRRFLVSFLGGGVGQVSVPRDYLPQTVLNEVTVVKDVDLAGNASLGIVLDHPRNRLLVATLKMNSDLEVVMVDLANLLLFIGAGDEKSLADDAAVDEEGNAYVTDAKASKIWKVGVNGEFVSIIRSPLFIAKEWYKNLVGLNGIVYHPNGFLMVIHTFSGNLFKIETGKGEEIKLIKVEGGPLSFGDGMELLSPTKLVVAGNHPSARLVESSDGWETASVVAKFSGPAHRLASAATVKDGELYLNHIIGVGYPKKHLLVQAVF